MASYDNLMAEQPWSFRPAFSDAWFSDLFTKETETITRALQSSIAGGGGGASSNEDFFPNLMLEPLFTKADTTPSHTPTVSGLSENESPVLHQRRSVPPSGRVAKRKPRASKRSAATTFITADPENFMRMVQQVTGAGSDQLPVMRNEPYRMADYGLPTFDTSAFLMDGAAASQPSTAVAGGGAELYSDSFCSFPTLESSRV